jgi:hypothetical protein
MSVLDEINTSVLDDLNPNILDELNNDVTSYLGLSLGSGSGSGSGSLPIFPICFIAGSKVLTDQGIIEIQDIKKDIHTIRGKKILYLTKTKLLQGDKLVKIEKDSLFENYPNRTTVLTATHKIFYNGNMVFPCDLVNKIPGVSYINYNNEILYNILLEKNGKMIVNNMISESLGNENIISFIYMLDISDKEKFQIIQQLNDIIQEYKYDKEMCNKFYKKIHKKYKNNIKK